jgi:hypothetical protein
MKEALSSSETSVLSRATRRYIPEDILFPVEMFLENSSLEVSREAAINSWCIELKSFYSFQ